MNLATATAPLHGIRIAPAPATAHASTVSPIKALCSTCHLREICLPCGLTGPEVERLDGLKFGRRKVAAGQTLYNEGDKFTCVYAVRSGTFKSSLVIADGREQVSGFHFPGELLGLDGLAAGKHASTATALEDTEVCAIPYANLSELSAGSPSLQMAMARLMSREIVREHGLMMLLGSMSAEERLAAFLLNLSQRMKARGYSPREFHLRMSRAEIGSYLGMKLETVSRTFSAFQQQGLLEVQRKHVLILDLEGLNRAFESRVQ
jgi:CRP/FNR family transcriptional regulator